MTSGRATGCAGGWAALGLSVALALWPALPAQAQAPANPPPPDFAGNSFTDAGGCVFQRGDQGWLPRRNRDGSALCGYPPTPITAPSPAAVPDDLATTPTPPATVAAPSAPPVTVGASEQPPTAPPVVAQADPAEAATAPKTRPGQSDCTLIGLTANGQIAAGPPLGYLGTPAAPRSCARPEATAFAAPAITPKASRARDPGPRADRSHGPRKPKSSGSSRRSGKPAKATGKAATRSAPAAARYIQVGAFAVPANSHRALSRILGMGLPAARGKGRIGGQPVAVIYAGPFDDPAALARALHRLHQAGYAEAFAR